MSQVSSDVWRLDATARRVACIEVIVHREYRQQDLGEYAFVVVVEQYMEHNRNTKWSALIF